MQRKKILAIGIALALQTSYYPAMAAENTDDDEKCPANSSSLSLSERNKLPATCLIANNENDNHWAWVAGGVAALATGVALGVHNSDTDGNAHGNNYAPTPTNDGGDDIVPPDDGGDDDDVIPPDDGDDDDDDTPVDHTVKTFINSVTINKGTKELIFDDIKLDNGQHLGGATLSYAAESDQWVLTTEDGKTLNVANWKVTDYNAAVMEGTQTNGLYWKYDSRGYLILADENTAVITGDGETHATTRGMTISGEGKTGVIISGDNTTNTLSGDSTASDGAVSLVITGDGTQNTISGNSTVDGAIGALISGYDTVTNASGEITVTGGGTAMIIDGDNITLNNTGISHISGQGSTGSIINGNNAKIANDGEMNVSDGATGASITGDNATISNKGNATTRGKGSVALIVDGDNATLTNEGTQSISDGATGSRIKGDDAAVNMTGDITVSGGGTAMIIDGRDASVVISGKSDISGQGSTGTVINGDKARITNDGELNVTDGATGAEIVGDNAVIDNTGDMSIDGAGSTALSIQGDNTLIISEGNQTITNGATGTRIDGDNARIANTGDISVDGAGSSAITIDGSDARLTQAGDLLVTHGATGITSYGENNTAKNIGNATVCDADSVGFIVAGLGNTFNNKGNIDVSLNGTGVRVSGKDATVALGGNITVTAEKDSNGLFRGATGVDISGDGSTTTISGNVNINAQFVAGDRLSSSENLSGIIVEGNNNTVILDGALSLNINDTSSPTDGPIIFGLDVEGDGNTVNIEQGMNLTYSDSGGDSLLVSGINVSGASTVTLGGDSVLNLNNIPGGAQILANIEDGGQLVLEDDATLIINKHSNSQEYFDYYAILTAEGTGSVIKNQGTIINNGTTAIMRANDGARVENSGDITSYARTADGIGRDAVIATYGQNTTAYNTAGGNITLISERKPGDSYGNAYYPMMWYQNTYYAMLAMNNGEVTNGEGATVSLYGAGVYGVSASKGTALNAGDIYLDGFVPVLDDAGNIVSKSYWSPAAAYLPSAAMVAGSTDSGRGNATAINTGDIIVNNAGFGMTALYGGTAINQGTITLTADSDTAEGANQLVGMAAIGNGIAINDTNGVINIDAAFGQPFYSSNGGTIINYGTICFDEDCQSGDDYDDKYVSLSLKDGDVITEAGETLTDKTIITDPTATETAHITNAGTISGGKVTINDYGDLTNESTGTVSSVGIATGGIYTNDGTTAAVSVDGGIFNNTGAVTGKTGTTVAGSVINNSGTMKSVEQWASTMNNTGLVSDWTGASGSTVLNNNAGGEVDKITFTGAATVNNAGVIKNGSVDKGGTLNNLEGGIITLGDNSLWSGTFNNWGTVNSDADIATSGSGHTLYNGTTGVINGQITTSKNNGGSKAINDGTINIDKTNNVAMSAHGSAKMVNNGTINVGTEGTSQTNMVGMLLESDAKADAVIENNGTINIYASNSYAFSQLGSNGHIVNNGTIYIDDDVTGSGFIKQDGKTIQCSGENGNGTETHYVDFTAPTVPTIDDGMAAANAAHSSSSSSSSSDMNNLSGYVVGTNTDGSAGQLMVNNASMSGVEINTGFTAGTADTTVSFDNVVKGSNLTDADAIQSTSVVWTAQGSTDADGNVDVTMSKNAYVDVATDGSVNGVAQALDAGYTNNELYTSLNVGTTAELNSALKQVSGSQATTVFREARIMSNRFTMLADAAPQVNANGLAFNVVAKGDPRAELGNDTQYDMLALRQKLELTDSQNLTLEYGIARLDGSGSQKAGDNGLTDGFSQFFGLKHSTAFDDDLVWNNSLRYDVHNLDSSRSISYSDTNKTADSSARQQYMEFRSEGAKTFTLMDDALKVTPYAGVKFRHTLEDGYKERSAGDFNLSMNAGSETAVDSIVGLKLDYAGDNGWSATATLEGGPNLSYSKSQRTASLQGAAGQSFSVDDGQKGGGVNGLATVGVKYSSKDTSLNVDAYQWKEDSINDKGFMLNVKKTFR